MIAAGFEDVATSGAMLISAAYSGIALGVALPLHLIEGMILAAFSLLLFYGVVRLPPVSCFSTRGKIVKREAPAVPGDARPLSKV